MPSPKVKPVILFAFFLITIISYWCFHFDHAYASPLSQIYSFTPAPCMFELPDGIKEGVDVKCGYVIVPEEYANPKGPNIKLAVVIIRSKESNPKSDPLFLAQGGPGGSTIDTYASRLLSDSRLRADRDIILFDQRGTMYSEPNLMCKEIDQLTLDTIEKDLSDDELERLELKAMESCQKRLANEGINLSAFDSLENASDIDTIRQALGYEKINLYGVSYGTLLSLHAMRLHPEILRSVILDGVVPPQTNFIVESAQSQDRAFNLLFETCENDPPCNRSYPNLENVFYNEVKKLNENPARIPMTDPDSKLTYNAVIDGDTFMSGLFQMLYISDLIPTLPRMIYDIREGRFDFFSRIMSILLFDRTMSYGMYYSVLCAEDADFNPGDQDLKNVHPEIARVEKRSPSEFLAVCKLWNVTPLSPEVDQPVISDIPTLILSGNYDPITPPSYGETAAKTLSNSHSYVVPIGGHGQAFEGACQDTIILSFLNDPTKPPDTRCLEDIDQIIFLTSSNIINMPSMIRILNLEGKTGMEMLIILLSLLVLGSSWLILPFAWLFGRVRRKPILSAPEETTPGEPTSPGIQVSSSKPFLIQASVWMALLAGVILWIFIIGLIAVLVEMVMKNDNRLFFGITAMARGWFVLPWIAALFNLGMLSASLIAWLKRHWSFWMRLYYSIITLAATTSLVILAKWGILTALV